MKKIIFNLFLCGFMVAFAWKAQAQNATVTVTWKFLGIEEGYDHPNKCKAFIDGEEVAVSTETRESVQNSMTFSVPAGKHEIEVINFAQYEGEWEEHTVANNYSLDCVYSGSITFKKKHNLYLLFDIDNGTSVSWKKMPKPKAK